MLEYQNDGLDYYKKWPPYKKYGKKDTNLHVFEVFCVPFYHFSCFQTTQQQVKTSYVFLLSQII